MSESWWQSTTSRAVALLLVIAVIASIWFFARPLAILTLGVTIAAALSPVVAFFDRWLPRILAALVVYLILALVIGLLLWVVIPTLVGQAQEIINRVPKMIDQLQNLLQWLGMRPGAFTLSNLLSTQFAAIAPTLVTLPLMLASRLFDIMLVIFVSLYSLIDAPHIRHYFLSLFPENHQEQVGHVLSHMFNAMGGYIRGSVINGLIIGSLTYVGLLLIGVDFPLTLGILAGMLELIPYIGPILAAAIIFLVTIAQSPSKALAVLIFDIILQQTEGHVLVPNIMHAQANISQLLVIIAVFAGGAIGGFLGVLVSVPLAAAAHVLFDELLAPVIRRRLAVFMD
jgi:putative permease